MLALIIAKTLTVGLTGTVAAAITFQTYTTARLGYRTLRRAATTRQTR